MLSVQTVRVITGKLKRKKDGVSASAMAEVAGRLVVQSSDAYRVAHRLCVLRTCLRDDTANSLHSLT